MLKKLGEFYEGEDEEQLAAQYFLQAADLFTLTKYHQTDTQKLKLKVSNIYSVMFEDPEKIKEAIKVI